MQKILHPALILCTLLYIVHRTLCDAPEQLQKTYMHIAKYNIAN